MRVRNLLRITIVVWSGLRRYYATKLIDADIEEAIITALMGHSDFITTQKHYYKNNKNMEYISERVSPVINR